MTASTTMTTKDFAAALGTDPKTVRKYLRSITPRDEQPGQGSRWELAGTKAAITKHRKGFAAFQEAELKRRADRAAKVAQDLAGKVEALDEDPIEVDEDSTDEVDPTDEDLAEVDEVTDED